MKKHIYTLALSIFITFFGLSGCQTSEQKAQEAQGDVDKAEENLEQANENLEIALQDSATEFDEFKQEVENKIVLNEQRIDSLKVKLANGKKETRISIQKKIDLLKKKNADLNKRMAEYSKTGKEKWESFKREFNHDMDELGNAISDLGTDNTK